VERGTSNPIALAYAARMVNLIAYDAQTDDSIDQSCALW